MALMQHFPPGPGRVIRFRQGKKKLFLKGPIPVAQCALASEVGGKALAVFLAIWLETSMKQSSTVTLSRRDMSRFGVAPDAGRRAILKLEKAGIVAVSRGSGRSPRVTLLFLDQKHVENRAPGLVQKLSENQHSKLG
jgi:hypothetical protein